MTGQWQRNAERVRRLFACLRPCSARIVGAIGALIALLRRWFDPGLAIAIIAPWIIQRTFAITGGRMAARPDYFSNANVVGTVDYAVALYTAVLVWLMFLFNYTRVGGRDAARSSPGEQCLWFLYWCMLAGGIICLLNIIPDRNVLGDYIARAEIRGVALGDPLGPYWESPITYFRFIAGGLGGIFRVTMIITKRR